MTPRQWQWMKAGLLLLGLTTLVILVQQDIIPWRQMTPGSVRTYLESFGWWAPIAFALICAQPLIPLPATIMLMAGGLAFGLVHGAIVAFLAIVVRAIGQFFIARTLGRGAVELLLRGRLAAFDSHVGRNQFESVLLIRVVPNLPFDLQNLCLGLSPVAFAPFAVATAIGVIPSVWVWSYIGHRLAQPGAWWQIALIAVSPALLVLGARWLWQRRDAIRALG